MRGPARLAALLFAFAAHADSGARIAAFSALEPASAWPSAWREIQVPRVKPSEYALVRDAGLTVLRVRSEAAGGSLAHALDVDAQSRPRLSWRWKVDRVVESADLRRKEGDDFAARVYVMFDLPTSALGLATRVKIQLARIFYGIEVPPAALCYVWDNRNAIGTMRANPYVDSVRMVVLQSGPGRVGTWTEESRDLEADFRAAFADLGLKATPRVVGVAIGNDTDQTGEAVTAWFGDLRLEARR